MNDIILPINSKDCLKSYTHNAFISSILFSDAVGGTTVAEYTINRDLNGKVINHGCCTEISDSCVKVVCPKNIVLGYSLFYYDCNDNDSMTLHVTHRRKSSSWERICIVIDDEIVETEFDPAVCLSKYGCPSNEKLFVKRKTNFLAHDDLKRILSSSYYLKVEKKGLKLHFSYSIDGSKWHDVYDDVLPAKNQFTNHSIGILVEARNNFMSWMTSNYIQLVLSYPYMEHRMLDYYLGMRKSYKTFVTNHFIDFMFDFVDSDNLNSKKLGKYIYDKIGSGFYLITELDHYYIEKTPAFESYKYFHEVLIYGVSPNQKKIYALGYGENDKVFEFELSFNMLWKSIRSNNLQFVLGRVNPNYENYLLESEPIKDRLLDYLNGTNSYSHIRDFIPKQLIESYGINALETIIKDDKELFAFCRETRMSYVLYEHKKLMNERVEFLISNNMIDSDEQVISEIKENMQSILSTSEMIKNLILMSEITSNKKTKMKNVKKYLIDIIDNEKSTYKQIIEHLI